jgi:allophanate hydrolase subunit 2
MKGTIVIKNTGYYNRYDKKVMLLKEGDVLKVVKINEKDRGYKCIKDGILVFVEMENVSQLDMGWEKI